MISTIHIKSWQSHQINEILPRKFCEIPAKLLWKKNKPCLGFEDWIQRFRKDGRKEEWTGQSQIKSKVPAKNIVSNIQCVNTQNARF